MPRVFPERSVARSGRLFSDSTRPIVFTAADVAIRTFDLSLEPPCSCFSVDCEDNKIMFGKVIALGSAIAIVLVAILLQMTTPAEVGPLGIFILFILVYMSVLGVLTYLLFWGSYLWAKTLSVMGLRRPLQPLSLRRAYYFASVLALAPIMLVGLQSVGEVGFYEVFLIVAFVAVGCVYMARRTA